MGRPIHRLASDVQVIAPIRSYAGEDTWLKVGGPHLGRPDEMYAIVTVRNGEVVGVDLGYNKDEALETVRHTRRLMARKTELADR